MGCPGGAVPGCTNGHEGLTCQRCHPGWHKSSGACAECDDASLSSATWTLVIVIVLVVGYSQGKHKLQDYLVRKLEELRASDEAADAETQTTENPVAGASVGSTTSRRRGRTRAGSVVQDFSARTLSGVVNVDGERIMGVALRSCFTPIRTAITYVQVTAQIGKVLHIQLPAGYMRDVVDSLKPLLTIWELVISAECRGLGGFALKWIGKVVGFPLILFLLILARYKMDRKRGVEAPEAVTNAKQHVFFGVFFVYPTICNVLFASWNCRQIGPDQTLLLDDDRIFCGTDDERVFSSIPIRLSIASWAVIGVFGFGIPLGFGTWIWWTDGQKEREVSEADVDSIRNSVYREEDHHKFGAEDRRLARATIRQVLALDRFSFLTYAYSPLCPFWESVDLIRKLCLVGLVVLVGRGSEAQIAAGNAISFAFFAAHMKVWPMKTNYDNYLRAACEVHVCMSITVAFVLKGDLSHEIVDRDFYDWVLVISGGCCVGLAGFLCVWMKMKQLRQMQRAAVQNKDTPEKAAYMRFKAGLSGPKDRKVLKEYLQRGGSASDSASASFGEASGGPFDEAGEAPPPHRDRPQPEPEPEPHHGNDLEEPLFSS
eukprot:COSAG04_NODE_1458_length_6631_cov_10.649878_1_plen_600_part_00